VTTLSEFNDPRLAAIYERLNGYAPGTQPAFYAALAARVDARTIVEVGCGTGLITRELARQGYQMTGLDPAPPMLAIGRTRPFGDQVAWIEGDVSQLGRPNADLVFMAGHVAQFFVDDDEWAAALGAMHRGLRAGGTLAFESRDPDARAWDRWDRAHTSAVIDGVEHWTECTSFRDGVAEMTNHYILDGDHLMSGAAMRFRSRDELASSLAAAGFTISEIYGDWDLRPPGNGAPELIVVAAR
jgi:SAM-dependent methyltransferase